MRRNNVKKAIKIAVYSFCTIAMLWLGGCWWFALQPVQPPYITRYRPYVAVLQFPYKKNERILEVIVREERGAEYDHTYDFVTCWHIKATDQIPAKNFKITIGDRPPGFKQVIPENGRPFTPVAGRKYVMKIETTNRGVDYCSLWAPKAK